MSTPEKPCVPFGPEWEKEMMKWRKEELVKELKTVLKRINRKPCTCGSAEPGKMMPTVWICRSCDGEIK